MIKEDTEMTFAEMKEFAEKQVAWYTKQVDWDSKEIRSLTEQIAKSRKSDKETQKSILEGDYSETVKSCFRGKWISDDTRKLLNDRARMCRARRHDLAMIEKYAADTVSFGKKIEIYGNI